MKKHLAGSDVSQMRDTLVAKDSVTQVLLGLVGLLAEEGIADTSGGLDEWREMMKRHREQQDQDEQHRRKKRREQLEEDRKSAMESQKLVAA